MKPTACLICVSVYSHQRFQPWELQTRGCEEESSSGGPRPAAAEIKNLKVIVGTLIWPLHFHLGDLGSIQDMCLLSMSCKKHVQRAGAA